MPQGAKPKPNRFSHFLSAVAAEAQPEKKGSHSIFKNAQSAETLVYIGSGGVPVKKKVKIGKNSSWRTVFHLRQARSRRSCTAS